MGYNVLTYTAIMSQTGTGAPTVVNELANGLGETPVWTRVSAGRYRATVTNGIFGETTERRCFGGSPQGTAGGYIQGNQNNANSFDILTNGTASPEDDWLDNTAIEIRVYLNT